jgi:hypothetical protein
MENGRELRVESSEVLMNSELDSAASSNLGEELHAEKEFEETEIAESDKHIDFSQFTKKDFVDLLKDLSKGAINHKTEETVKEAKHLFDEIVAKEKEQALARFLNEGGVKDDFFYRGDELESNFSTYFKLIRDNRVRQIRELEEKKNSNLYAKTQLLEKLRELVDAEDNTKSFHLFKEIQKEWKQIGAVPANQIKPLWASYNALVDRFYDNRNIYFELKELDRKKNLELKQELCVKAERLQHLDSIMEAVKELNELHHEYRHIGPVPAEEKDQLWQRFKAASDAVYAKRDSFVEDLQREWGENLVKKNEMNEAVLAFASFTSDRIKEWNAKTQEILELQKKWDAIGSVPRAKGREVNKKFWNAFKQFFHNKNVFFKKLDEERSKNLQLKNEIVNRVLELKESQDWETASSEIKDLQRQWKEIGPVPEKHREKIFAKFKEACDYFFEQLRSSQNKEVSEQKDNLTKKEAIIAEINNLIQNGTATAQQLRDLQNQFFSIGFVPKQSVTAIKSQFTESMQKALASLQLADEEREQVMLEVQLEGLRNDPNAERKIHFKEQHIRKQIAKAENDLAVLQNNLEFFGRSKNAEKLKEEFAAKIKEASDHLQQLKKQLQFVQTV